MNKNLKRLALLAFLSVGLFSCKKENDMFNNSLNGGKLSSTSDKHLTDSRLLQEAKGWYETTTKSSSSVISTEKGTFKLKFDLNWEDAEFSKEDGKRVIYVPLKTNLSKIFWKESESVFIIEYNNDQFEARTLLMNKNAEKINRSNRYNVTFKENNNAKNSNANFRVVPFSTKKDKEKKNPNQKLGGNSKLSNTLNNSSINILQNNENMDRGTNSAQLNKTMVGGTPSKCFDYYLVVAHYDEYGYLVSVTETYMGTSCETYENLEPIDHLPPGEGGAGGSGDPVVEAMFETAEISFEIGGSGSESTLSESSTTRQKHYSWPMAGNNLWGWYVISYDVGTHTKVGTEWHWTSLVHNNFTVNNKPSYLTVDVTLNGIATANFSTATHATITKNATVQAYVTIYGMALGGRSSTNSRTSPVFNSNN